jgi:hypothetical protein
VRIQAPKFVPHGKGEEKREKRRETKKKERKVQKTEKGE